MCRLFETIKCVNRKLLNVDYHNSRVNQSRRQLFKAGAEWDLAELITIPEMEADQIYKCRVTYGATLGEAEFIPYRIRPLTEITLVEASGLVYDHKFTDRFFFEQLKQNSSEGEDFIIVQKGRITDLSYANLVFWDGRRWVTPSSPLLKGTKRQQYLDDCRIVEGEITVENLYDFEKIRIINAMIDLEESMDFFVNDTNIHIKRL